MGSNNQERCNNNRKRKAMSVTLNGVNKQNQGSNKATTGTNPTNVTGAGNQQSNK